MPPARPARVASCALVAVTLLSSCDTLEARHLAHQAAGLYKDGRLAEAAESYQQASSLDPSIATVHLNLGFTYLSLYEAAPRAPEAPRYGEGAVREFKQYIALKPDDPRGRQYLIQTFIDSKRYDDAVAFFEPEVGREPPSREAIGLLGQIAAKVGRFPEALGWYQRRVDLSPGDTEALEGLGVLIWDHLHTHPELTGQPRTDLADRGIGAMRRATELRPNAAEAYSYWNLLLRERAAGRHCALPDGGPAEVALDGGIATTDGGVAIEGCQQAKARDLLEADHYMRVAADLFRARAAVKPPGTSQSQAQPPAPSPARGR